VARPDFLSDRPRQVSRVLDALLADARWAALIDDRRIAAIGHSAGGYTVLALAGGQPDAARLRAHCGPQGGGQREDAAMCRLGTRGGVDAPPAAAPASGVQATPVDLRDARIRAVVADAPLGVPFVPDSLQRVDVPVLLEYGARDEVLAPRFHAQALCAALPHVTCVRSDDAGHFALFQVGTGQLSGKAGDPSEDPAGFDRRAWQEQAWPRIRDFLAGALQGDHQ